MMSSIDLTLYFLPFGLILVTIYVFPRLHQSLKDVPLLSSWIASVDDKTQTSRLSSLETTGKAGSDEVQKEPQFSAKWWSDPQLYELEKRAIFSKNWHFATHISRFTKPGDYLTLSLGGYSVFLILGKDQVLRTFHNVCRHRAYEVTRKECGSSTVLGCRYHGWSYDTRGQLTKAPQFEDVPGFEKKMNGLWEIHTFVAPQSGLVFVNLESGPVVEMEGSMVEKAVKGWNMRGSKMVEEMKMDGNFDWKLAVSARAGAPSSDLASKPWSWTSLAKILPQSITKTTDLDLPPTTQIYHLPAYSAWLTIKTIPTAPEKTTIHWTLYAQSSSTPLPPLNSILKNKLQSDIKALETLQQELRSGSAMLTGEAQIGAQTALQVRIQAHRKAEQQEGREIHPASRQAQTLSKEGIEDDELCRSLDREAAAAGVTKEIKTPEAEQIKGLDW